MNIDHIGIVVKDIKKSSTLYQKLLGFEKKSIKILDKNQKVYIQFLENNKGERVELVQPLDETSPSYNALTKGGGFNHICFKTKNIKKKLSNLTKEKCIVVCPPVKGAGHQNRLIAFVVHPLMGLIELVEYK